MKNMPRSGDTDVIMPAWTRKEFTNQLRKAGWKALSPKGWTYVWPETGAHFQPDRWSVTTDGVMWQWYAERHRLPPTDRTLW